MSETTLSAALRTELKAIEVDWHHPSIHIGDTQLEADTLRDLRQLLSGHLYSAWHIRRSATDAESKILRDKAFEDILRSHTPHPETRAFAEVLEHSAGKDYVLLLDGVRVRVAQELVTQELATAANESTRVQVAIPSCRPALSPGFWLVDSSSGRLVRAGHLTRFYLSIPDRDVAPTIWARTLEALEDSGIRYRAKIGSTERTYPRTDAMVIYVDNDDRSIDGSDAADAVSTLLRQLVEDGLPLSDNTSLFTSVVTRGIGTAAEPRDRRSGMNRMSFGEHRCFAVATGVLSKDSRLRIEARVVAALTEANIRPDNLALNIH